MTNKDFHRAIDDVDQRSHSRFPASLSQKMSPLLLVIHSLPSVERQPFDCSVYSNIISNLCSIPQLHSPVFCPCAQNYQQSYR